MHRAGKAYGELHSQHDNERNNKKMRQDQWYVKSLLNVKTLHNKVIAVDFDGCLCKNDYPDIGEANTEVIDELLQEYRNGAKLILWTCRAGDYLQKAEDWCRDHNIIFEAVNMNIPEHIERFGGDTRKVYADEYWDDRAIKKPDC